MKWNYRIIKGEEACYLHEVYYNDKEEVEFITSKPIVVGDTPEEIIKDLKLMLNDAENRDILEDEHIPFDIKDAKTV